MKTSGRISGLLALCLIGVSPTFAEPPDIAGIAFLVGHWNVGSGRVLQFGAIPSGTSDVTREANGNYTVREHIAILGVERQVMGTIDSTTLIHAENGTVLADFTNGGLAIHFKAVDGTAGRSVVFASDPTSSGQVFQMIYDLTGPNTLTVTRSEKRVEDKTFATFEFDTLTRGS